MSFEPSERAMLTSKGALASFEPDERCHAHVEV